MTDNPTRRAHGGAFEITPGTGSLSSQTRAIYCGGAGQLVVEMADGSGAEVIFRGVTAGSTLEIRVDKVLAVTVGSPTEATTCIGIVGLT